MDLVNTVQCQGLKFRELEIADHPYTFKFKRNTLIYFGFFLMICFSSLSMHHGVPISPNLVFLVLGMVIVFTFTTKVKFDVVPLVAILIIFYILSTQFIIGAPAKRYIGLAIGMFYFVFIVMFGSQLTNSQLKSISRVFILISLVILVLETLWRVFHPVTEYGQFGDVDIRWIYQYKYNSILYEDSNATGIHLVVLLFFVFYLEDRTQKSWLLTKSIFVGLIALTFSRAAWIGTAIGWIYYKFAHRRRLGYILFWIGFLCALFFISLAVYYWWKADEDISFLSKFEILGLSLDYLRTASLNNLFFGIGFTNSFDRLGIYAHSLILVFLIETGIIGLILLLVLFGQFVKITNRNALLILIPFLITTLSATITYLPFFFSIMAIMYLLERNKDNQLAA